MQLNLMITLLLTNAFQIFTPQGLVFTRPEIHGHVYDQEGKPVRAAQVAALNLSRAHSGPAPSAFTNSRGEFVVPLTEYGDFNVFASLAGTASASATAPVHYGLPAIDIELRLPAGRR